MSLRFRIENPKRNSIPFFLTCFFSVRGDGAEEDHGRAEQAELGAPAAGRPRSGAPGPARTRGGARPGRWRAVALRPRGRTRESGTPTVPARGGHDSGERPANELRGTPVGQGVATTRPELAGGVPWRPGHSRPWLGGGTTAAPGHGLLCSGASHMQGGWHGRCGADGGDRA
jgi:hypothetical protein